MSGGVGGVGGNDADGPGAGAAPPPTPELRVMYDTCMISFCAQDCVVPVVLAPYPNDPNPAEFFNFKTDFDLQLLPVQRATWFGMRTLNTSPTAPKRSE
jgi:hypothetical protein